MCNKVTIILSHPNLDNSFINKHLADINRKNDKILVHHLDKIAPNGYFDLETEKRILRESTAVVWQFPVYWYNCPASLRLWQDQVLSPIVYGDDNFLKGKPVAVVFTAGATEEHYRHEGLNRFTAEEMLVPFKMTANACGMVWHRPLGIYGCGPDMGAGALGDAESDYARLIEEL